MNPVSWPTPYYLIPYNEGIMTYKKTQTCFSFKILTWTFLLRILLIRLDIRCYPASLKVHIIASTYACVDRVIWSFFDEIGPWLGMLV